MRRKVLSYNANFCENPTFLTARRKKSVLHGEDTPISLFIKTLFYTRDAGGTGLCLTVWGFLDKIMPPR
jgi:hypothetical protein